MGTTQGRLPGGAHAPAALEGVNQEPRQNVGGQVGGEEGARVQAPSIRDLGSMAVCSLRTDTRPLSLPACTQPGGVAWGVWEGSGPSYLLFVLVFIYFGERENVSWGSTGVGTGQGI